MIRGARIPKEKKVKNRILTIAMAVTATSGLALTAMAQDQQAPAPAAQEQHQHKAPDPARQAHRLTQKLGLSADQESQLVPILTNRNQQFMALRSDTSLSEQDRHAKMLGLRQDTDAKIKSVLTDSQKAQFDQLRQQEHGRRHQGN